MFDKLKKLLGVKTEGPRPEPPSEAPPKPKKQAKKEKELTPKELATQNGEPYVAILKVDIDPTDINNGSFELDWNDKFLTNLIKQGYKMDPKDTDNDIVDRWFQTVCRNIALEVYEQRIADPDKRGNDDLRVIRKKDLGDGRSEVS
jgi:hypothetical protein